MSLVQTDVHSKERSEFMKYKTLFIFLIVFSVTVSLADAGEWVTFKSVSKSAAFELKGILTKPEGEGPFPAIVMLHGAGGIEGGGKYLEI